MKHVPRILNILVTLPLGFIVVFSIFDDYSLTIPLTCLVASFIVLFRWKFLREITETLGKKKLLLRSGSLYLMFFLLTIAVLVLAIAKLPSAMPWVLAVVLTQPVILFLYSLFSGFRMLLGGREPTP